MEGKLNPARQQLEHDTTSSCSGGVTGVMAPWKPLTGRFKGCTGLLLLSKSGKGGINGGLFDTDGLQPFVKGLGESHGVLGELMQSIGSSPLASVN